MNKYRAKAIDTPDGRFHSKGEYARWCELKLLQKAGEIRQLERQVSFVLRAACEDGLGPRAIGQYVADFTYVGPAGFVIEDFKGHDTPLSRWKRKHLFNQIHQPVTLTGPASKKRGVPTRGRVMA